jgi:hypothetical protein
VLGHGSGIIELVVVDETWDFREKFRVLSLEEVKIIVLVH